MSWMAAVSCWPSPTGTVTWARSARADHQVDRGVLGHRRAGVGSVREHDALGAWCWSGSWWCRRSGPSFCRVWVASARVSPDDVGHGDVAAEAASAAGRRRSRRARPGAATRRMTSRRVALLALGSSWLGGASAVAGGDRPWCRSVGRRRRPGSAPTAGHHGGRAGVAGLDRAASAKRSRSARNSSAVA